MRYKVVYLELAKQDVVDIRNYLSQFYPDTPKRFLAELKQGIEHLQDNPFMYAEYEDNRTYRKMVVLDYLVFYKVFEATAVVEVHRVLHGRRNVTMYLPKD